MKAKQKGSCLAQQTGEWVGVWVLLKGEIFNNFWTAKYRMGAIRRKGQRNRQPGIDSVSSVHREKSNQPCGTPDAFQWCRVSNISEERVKDGAKKRDYLKVWICSEFFQSAPHPQHVRHEQAANILPPGKTCWLSKRNWTNQEKTSVSKCVGAPEGSHYHWGAFWRPSAWQPTLRSEFTSQHCLTHPRRKSQKGKRPTKKAVLLTQKQKHLFHLPKPPFLITEEVTRMWGELTI